MQYSWELIILIDMILYTSNTNHRCNIQHMGHVCCRVWSVSFYRNHKLSAKSSVKICIFSALTVLVVSFCHHLTVTDIWHHVSFSHHVTSTPHFITWRFSGSNRMKTSRGETWINYLREYPVGVLVQKYDFYCTNETAVIQLNLFIPVSTSWALRGISGCFQFLVRGWWDFVDLTNTVSWNYTRIAW